LSGREWYVWLAPLRGPSFKAEEFLGVELEKGLWWRSTEEADETVVRSFAGHFLSEIEAGDLIGASSVLEGLPMRSFLLAAKRRAGQQLEAFLLGLSLHVAFAPWTRPLWSTTDKHGTNRAPLGISRQRSLAKLPGWRVERPLSDRTLAKIVASFQSVRDAQSLDSGHPVRRAVMQYGAALRAEYVETVAIHLVSCLESLAVPAGKDGETRAKKYLLPRLGIMKVRAQPADGMVRGLYAVRHSGAHALGSRKVAVHLQRDLGRGLSLVKLVLSKVLSDPAAVKALALPATHDAWLKGAP
jgi:hypothetical protein